MCVRVCTCMCVHASVRVCACVCVRACVCVCVGGCISVAVAIVKRPVLPLCVEDGRCRNFLYHYYY